MGDEKSKQDEKVSIFIDGNNFYFGCKSAIGTADIVSTANFKKFIEIVLDGRKLVDVYYYNALLDKNKDKDTFEKQQKFLEELRKIGMKVILCNVRKKNVDGKVIYAIKWDDANLAVGM